MANILTPFYLSAALANPQTDTTDLTYGNDTTANDNRIEAPAALKTDIADGNTISFSAAQEMSAQTPSAQAVPSMIAPRRGVKHLNRVPNLFGTSFTASLGPAASMREFSMTEDAFNSTYPSVIGQTLISQGVSGSAAITLANQKVLRRLAVSGHYMQADASSVFNLGAEYNNYYAHGTYTHGFYLNRFGNQHQDLGLSLVLGGTLEHGSFNNIKDVGYVNLTGFDQATATIGASIVFIDKSTGWRLDAEAGYSYNINMPNPDALYPLEKTSTGLYGSGSISYYFNQNVGILVFASLNPGTNTDYPWNHPTKAGKDYSYNGYGLNGGVQLFYVLGR